MINQNLFLKDLLLTLDLNLKDESKLEVEWYGEHYSVSQIHHACKVQSFFAFTAYECAI